MLTLVLSCITGREYIKRVPGFLFLVPLWSCKGKIMASSSTPRWGSMSTEAPVQVLECHKVYLSHCAAHLCLQQVCMTENVCIQRFLWAASCPAVLVLARGLSYEGKEKGRTVNLITSGTCSHKVAGTVVGPGNDCSSLALFQPSLPKKGF